MTVFDQLVGQERAVATLRAAVADAALDVPALPAPGDPTRRVRSRPLSFATTKDAEVAPTVTRRLSALIPTCTSS